MKSVLLRRRANRQYRGRAVLDPPRDLVPPHAFDEMAIGMRSHSSGLLYVPTETPVKSPAVIHPCR